ncbi:Nn.00g002770.m01.CDS01 [Neocucurbitaria sp. VM-36]
MLNHPVDSPDSETPKKPHDQPLNRACEACRVSKVRCLVNPVTGSTQCQRCAKAGKACVFAPPAKRRQRKRTDVRVTELEKEIQQMRSLLKSTNRSSNDLSDHESVDEQSDGQLQPGEKETPQDPQSHGSAASTTSNFANQWSGVPVDKTPAPGPSNDCGPRDLLGPSENDIMDRAVITEAQAEELLAIWRTELVNGCPGITIPREWTVMEFRARKPALFHAIMAAAAHSKGSALSDKLHEEAVYLYARSAFIKGEKSVQAIQALLVTITYYSPPKTPGQLQIYQWVNMAASMALELGLASKPRTHEQLPKRAIRSLQRISSPEELLEHCRTVLLVYIISAGFSMRLKRPNILLFNSWMEECFNILEKSNSLDDKRIIAWLKLQRIADEANTAFGFDDASTSFSLSELRMQIILRIFDRRMQDWKKSVPDDVLTVFATIEFHQNMLSMWEFGMDGGRYDVTEFRNRHLTLPALDDDCVQPESLLSRSALQINATTKCIGAAHSILECFFSIPTEKLQKAPNVIYVRAIYALVALMKAEYAVGTDAEMGELLESQSLKVDYYLDTVLKKASDARGPQKCRIPSHWSFVLEAKLKSWWDEYQEWRKEGRHLKRRKMNEGNKSEAATDDQTPAFAEVKNQPSTSSNPMQPSSNQGMPTTSQFALGTSYPSWNSSDVHLDPTTSAQTLGDQATFTPDIGDFSAAFQNGDLYLWNDMTADTFGGWGPQGGLYTGMGYGPLNGQGF